MAALPETPFDNSTKDQALRALWRADLSTCEELLRPHIPESIKSSFDASGNFVPVAEFPTSVSASQLWYLIQFGEPLFLKAFLSGTSIEVAMAFAAKLAELAETHRASVVFPPSPELAAEDRARAAWMYAEAQCICAEIELGRVLVLAKSRSWLKLLFPLKASWAAYQQAHLTTQDPLFQQHAAYLRDHAPHHPSFPSSSSPSSSPSSSSSSVDFGAELYQDPLAERVQFGVGLFQFGASLLPPAFLWVAEALGFRGDRKVALACLKAAAKNKQGLRWVHARLLLAGYAWFFGAEEGEKIAQAALQRLRQDLPDSPILDMITAHVHRRFGDLDASLEMYQRVIAAAGQVEQFRLTATYEISTIHWFRGDYPRCAELVQEYLDRTTNWAYRCFGAYKLGFCLYKMHGPTPDVIQSILRLYARIPDWVDPKMSHDRYALRKTQQFITHQTFDAFELAWIPANASFHGCLYQKCIDQLGEVVNIVKDKSKPAILPLKDRLAMCFYLRGTAYAALENSKEAAANFQNLFQLQESVEIERWVIPFGFVETANLFLKKKNFEKATLYLDKARSFPGEYDLDKPLSFKIKKIHTQIQKDSVK